MVTKAHIHSSVTRIRKYCSNHLQIYIQHKQSFLESTNIFNHKAIQKHKLLRYTCTTNLISTYIAITQKKKYYISILILHIYIVTQKAILDLYWNYKHTLYTLNSKCQPSVVNSATISWVGIWKWRRLGKRSVLKQTKPLNEMATKSIQ